LTTNTTTITLPRLPDESAPRYQARTEYILMGADRSLEAVSKKLGKSRELMERWSTADKWVSLAADYDQTVYTLAAQAQSDAYRADLADYRKRYGEMGKALYQASGLLLKRVIAQAQSMDVGVGTLTLITNAAKTAADLEALALRVEDLLQNERSSE
jgi:hypothetical protein